MTSRRLKAHLRIGPKPRRSQPDTSPQPWPGGVTHRYITTAGAALRNPDHAVHVIDDQAGNCRWYCAACPASHSHVYHRNVHEQAQAHAAQCTALIQTAPRSRVSWPDIVVLVSMCLSSALLLALVLTGQ